MVHPTCEVMIVIILSPHFLDQPLLHLLFTNITLKRKAVTALGFVDCFLLR